LSQVDEGYKMGSIRRLGTRAFMGTPTHPHTGQLTHTYSDNVPSTNTHIPDCMHVCVYVHVGAHAHINTCTRLWGRITITPATQCQDAKKKTEASSAEAPGKKDKKRKADNKHDKKEKKTKKDKKDKKSQERTLEVKKSQEQPTPEVHALKPEDAVPAAPPASIVEEPKPSTEDAPTDAPAEPTDAPAEPTDAPAEPTEVHPPLDLKPKDSAPAAPPASADEEPPTDAPAGPTDADDSDGEAKDDAENDGEGTSDGRGPHT